MISKNLGAIPSTKENNMMKQFKVIVEKHPDGYVAYPLGFKGIIVGEGDTLLVKRFLRLNHLYWKPL